MSTEPRSTPRYLIIGEVLRPHGVRGELRIRILTDYPERIVKGKTLFLGTDPDRDDARPYQVDGMRANRDYGLLKLNGIEDRDAADLLRELLVMVPLEDAVPLDEGEVYLFELIGMEVRTDAGALLGELVDVLETGANDVYVVDSPQYGEVLLPVTPECVLEVDADAGVITVHIWDGLLPNR
jgi:16S rRNA processing protein RimM